VAAKGLTGNIIMVTIVMVKIVMVKIVMVTIVMVTIVMVTMVQTRYKHVYQSKQDNSLWYLRFKTYL
jgi:hypothetical protein